LPVTRFEDLVGGTFDLQSLRGRRVLLVVLRGFTSQVCVYCFAQTAELGPRLADFAAADCEVVVLFPGTKGRAEAFRRSCTNEFDGEPPPYRILYDPELTLGKALGIEGRIVRPASLVLDADGVVRFAYVAENVQNIADRPAADRLLRAVRELGR
jgi:peroxiredoxin